MEKLLFYGRLKSVYILLPQGYNPKDKPWVKIQNATTKELVEQVSKCLSGALTIK